MKRADTILRKIDELENELIMNYTDSEIIQAYEKIYNQKGFHKPFDGLVSVIYEDVKQFS